MGIEILKEMQRQAQGKGEEHFICKSCTEYNGGLNCEKNVFIAFEGANMSGCQFYRWGRICPHCGGAT